MKVFRKENVILAVFLFTLSCTITFAQEKDSKEQKNQADIKKNQEKVFDASTATLEEAQDWLQKTLIKYGKITSTHSNVAFKSRVENVQFKGYELSYTRYFLSESSQPTSDTSSTTLRESMAATDFRNLYPTYVETMIRLKINLPNLDADKIKIIDKGKVVWVEISSRDDLNKSAIEVDMSTRRPTELETRDNVSPTPNIRAYKTDSEPFIVNNKQIASQLKDVLVRMITLCQ